MVTPSATSLPVPPPRPRWLFATMIVLSVGYILFFLCSLVGVVISPFLFDSGDTPRNWHAFYLVIALPILILAGAGVSWGSYRWRCYPLIPVGLVLPIVDVIVFCTVFS